MDGLFASMSVKWALDKLSSLLPVSLTSPLTASSSSSSAMQDLEDLRSLERTMHRIHAMLEDAEERWNIREESAKLRLEELKEVAYDAEDVVDEYEYEVNLCKLEALGRSASVESSNNKRKRLERNGTSAIDTGTVAVPNELVVRARQIIKRYDEIIKDYGNLALSENDGERRSAPDISSLREVGSVVCERSILGREHDKDNIVEKLLSREDERIGNRISVQAIVGMGGLGKTTLAQLVYNDPRVSQSFDKLAWVCVSEKFDVSDITRKIITSLTKNKCDVTELANLQGKLLDEIKEQKVLLVLDDVWNERGDSWERLCTPLSKTRVCKVIVTTRSEVVANLVRTMPFYRINILSPAESWSLFKQVAFAVHQENDTPVNLVEIGRSIVKKCEGLPLAIKTLASMLRYETDEGRWSYVLESQLWNLEQSQNEVLPALMLSYKHMPIHLKRCFVALSLFSKGHLLLDVKVLHLWKILDLLQRDGSNDEDETGLLYLNYLVQRSFLQVYFDDYAMHDLVHDLACFLAGEEFFRLEGDTRIEIPQKARYVSIPEADTSVEISIAPHSVRAIIVLAELNDNIIQNPEALFLHCKKLRALSLGQSMLLKALPDNMGSLKLLRHLKFYKNWGEPTASGIRCLINLHRLPPIHMSRCDCNCNIRELRNLNEIRKLRIEGWGSLCLIEDANEAQLLNKKHLHSLELDFDMEQLRYCPHSVQTEPVTVTHEQLLDSLRPHDGLRELRIENYESQKYPNWLGNASFDKLTKIVLSFSKSQHVPTLGVLPSLKSLEFRYMDCVQRIGREFCSHVPGMNGFRSLARLEFCWMDEWSEWSGVDDGDFPCLHTLEIKHAVKLRSLPWARFPSLVTLILRSCLNLSTVPAWPTLRELTIEGCGLNELATLPSLLKLELWDCPNLSAVGSLPSLTTLNLIVCPNLSAVGSLPSLTTLNYLSLLPRQDEMLQMVPMGSWFPPLTFEAGACGLSKPECSRFPPLPSLTSLNLMHILPQDETLHRLLNYHPSLECVTIICGLECIHLDPQGLPSLRKLRLSCPNLQYCDGIAGLTCLKELKLWSCPNLPVHRPGIYLQNPDIRESPEILLMFCNTQHLPTLGELPSLKSLDVCAIRYVRHIGREFCSHVPGVKGFPSLTRLKFDGMKVCSEWSGVDIGEFPCLETLSIDDAYNLRSLPSVPFLPLLTINLYDCKKLATIPACPTLRKLSISGCPKLSSVGSLPSLTTLNLEHGLPQDETLHRLLNYHALLECVTIICDSTECIRLDSQDLPSLRKLRLSCDNLQYCDGIAGLTCLKELRLWGCPNLPVHRLLLPRQLQNPDIRDELAWGFEEFDHSWNLPVTR